MNHVRHKNHLEQEEREQLMRQDQKEQMKKELDNALSKLEAKKSAEKAERLNPAHLEIQRQANEQYQKYLQEHQGRQQDHKNLLLQQIQEKEQMKQAEEVERRSPQKQTLDMQEYEDMRGPSREEYKRCLQDQINAKEKQAADAADIERKKAEMQKVYLKRFDEENRKRMEEAQVHR